MDVIVLAAGKPHDIEPANLWQTLQLEVREWQGAFFESFKTRALFVFGDEGVSASFEGDSVINARAATSGSGESLLHQHRLRAKRDLPLDPNLSPCPKKSREHLPTTAQFH